MTGGVKSILQHGRESDAEGIVGAQGRSRVHQNPVNVVKLSQRRYLWQLYGGLRRFDGDVAYIIRGRAYSTLRSKCLKAPLSNEGFMVFHNLLESGALMLCQELPRTNQTMIACCSR